jgi:type II secretory pathway pseudopilin PulG
LRETHKTNNKSVQPKTKGEEMRHKEKGDVLISMLIVLVIMAALLSVAAPSIIKLQQVTAERSAAVSLAQISAAEMTFAQLYGVYVPPSGSGAGQLGLTGNLALANPAPGTCPNPFLLTGQQAQGPAGYAMTWTTDVAVAPTNANCAAVAGTASAWHINLDPSSQLTAQRHFYLDQTGIVRFNETQAAGPGDPQYPVSIQVSSLLNVAGAAPIPVPPAPPPAPVGSGLPGGTYTVTADFYGGGSIIGTMDGTITIDPSTGNITSAQLGNCSAGGVMTSGSNQDSLSLNAGGGCSWGGSTFTGQASFQNQDYNMTFTAPQNCGGCGQSVAITGTQQ